jgi:methylase of polypeptide subunit release factors
VRDYEPHAALVGEGTTEAVAQAALAVLRPGAALVLEVGDDGAAATCALLESLGYTAVTITADLTERERVVEGRR